MDSKKFKQALIAGIATILPLMLTIYLVIWLGGSAEAFFGSFIQLILPENWYLPGLGLLTAMLLTFAIGLLTHTWILQRTLSYSEKLLYGIPVIKSIYSSLKDLTDFFAKPDKNDFNEVVSVNLAISNVPARLIGFVTVGVNGNSPVSETEEEMITVYLPMSYQIGGYTITIPRSAATPIDLPLEEAMRYVLTAGLAKTRD